LAENDIALGVGAARQTKSYASENDLFSFSAFWIAPLENGHYRRGKVIWQDSSNAA
jgi:hypothetical protein